MYFLIGLVSCLVSKCLENGFPGVFRQLTSNLVPLWPENLLLLKFIESCCMTQNMVHIRESGNVTHNVCPAGGGAVFNINVSFIRLVYSVAQCTLSLLVSIFVLCV